MQTNPSSMIAQKRTKLMMKKTIPDADAECPNLSSQLRLEHKWVKEPHAHTEWSTMTTEAAARAGSGPWS